MEHTTETLRSLCERPTYWRDILTMLITVSMITHCTKYNIDILT